MASKLEKLIEGYLRKKVIKLGGLCIKLLPFCMAGLPDRLVILPGGRIYFIELKRESGGKLSPMQKIVFSKLEKLGFPVYVLNTYELIDKFLDNN